LVFIAVYDGLSGPLVGVASCQSSYKFIRFAASQKFVR
jgi:hypothetical protein